MKPKSIYEIHDEVLTGQLSRFPPRTWDQTDSKEQYIKLVRRMVLERLELGRERFCELFSMNLLVQWKLNSGFMALYKRNIRPLVTDAFPEWGIRPWELQKSRVPASYWNKQTCIEATRWLIVERLGWKPERVEREIAKSHFKEHHLAGMLQVLKIGAADAVMLAYPERDWTYLKERRGYRITPEQAADIRRLHGEGRRQRELARIYECDPISIHSIVHGRTFKKTK